MRNNNVPCINIASDKETVAISKSQNELSNHHESFAAKQLRWWTRRHHFPNQLLQLLCRSKRAFVQREIWVRCMILHERSCRSFAGILPGFPCSQFIPTRALQDGEAHSDLAALGQCRVEKRVPYMLGHYMLGGQIYL